MTLRLSDQILNASWPVIADDLRRNERDRRVAAAVAENDALMADSFDGDAADSGMSMQLCAWCCVASGVVAIGVGLLITWLCGGF